MPINTPLVDEPISEQGFITRTWLLFLQQLTKAIQSITDSIASLSNIYMVQQVRTLTGTYATGTTQIPNDTTIPQQTEGDQYMSLAITPTDANNLLEIRITANFSASALAGLTMALFQDSNANALASQVVTIGASGYSNTIAITYYMVAGTTSTTTFKMRAGINTAGSTYFNIFSGALGGTIASSMIITELKQ